MNNRSTPETDALDCASFEHETWNLSRLAFEEYLLRLWLGKTSAPVSIFELWKVEEELVEAMKHGNVMPEHWLTKSYAANRNEIEQEGLTEILVDKSTWQSYDIGDTYEIH